MAELIEMLFWLSTRVGHHLLDWGQDPSIGRGNFEGQGAAHCKGGHSAVTCAKTAEPIVMPFGLLARTRPRNHHS